MDRAARLKSKKAKMAVVGLGYVGLPLAAAFAKHADVIGYDIDRWLIESLQNGIDPTGEVGGEAVSKSGITFTSDPMSLWDVEFIIVAVPTPVNDDNSPDLSALEEVSRTIGRHLSRGTIISFESTVYPGVTEEVCLPLLERHSGLVPGRDFFIGYSPERANPGDRVNTLQSVIKPVAANEPETLKDLCELYAIVCESGVYPMNSIRAAEAAKIAENTQRDVNIAFMNELAVILDAMNIDIGEVLGAMKTKWNALGFVPGLVGGHCIGVDPYYLIEKAANIGIATNLIRVARDINEAMPAYVVRRLIDKFNGANKIIADSKIAVLGVTFKENCPDIRGSKAAEIARMLMALGAKVSVVDPVADNTRVAYSYGIGLTAFEEIAGSSAVIVAVAHRDYREMDMERLSELCPGAVIMDIKGILDGKKAVSLGHDYWRL